MRRVPQALRESGFTLLEMIIVMFLLVAMLGIVIPRINLDEDLASTGRKFIGALRTLQGVAMSSQKPVKLYLDIDRNLYWVRTLEGKEEKPLLDATWELPRALPESIRLAEVSSGPVKKTSGRFELMMYPNGRIDGVVIQLLDANNQVLGIVVESATGAIRVRDERMDIQRTATVPDRVKQLLIPAATGTAGTAPGPVRS